MNDHPDTSVAEPDAAEGSEPVTDGPLSRRSQLYIVGAGVVIGFFAAVYVYNTVAFSNALLSGDQFYWVEFVLAPYERGDLSLFDAITFEYQVLSHGHIPSLLTFLFSYHFLDLSLDLDRVVGVASLGLMLWIVFRHARSFLSLDAAMITTAIASAILFRSSAHATFSWSLLQFQLFYLLVAFVYLKSFVKWHDTHPLAHAAIAMPLTLLLGDAMGTAAVGASFLYLLFLAITKRVPVKTLAFYYGLFVVQLAALATVFTGSRKHGNSSWVDFAEFAVTEPLDLAKGFYYSFANVFVALPPDQTTPFLSWFHVRYWFALTVMAGAVAVYLLARTKLRRRDYFPILLILTGCVWILGVVRTRVIDQGPEALLGPRLAMYIGVIGVGLVLLFAAKTLDKPKLRTPLLAVAAIVVFLGGLGSFNLTDNQRWVGPEESLAGKLEAYVLDESQEFIDGSRCELRASCLRAGTFLYDQGLVPLDDVDVPPEPWETEVRQATYARWDGLELNQRKKVCNQLRNFDDLPFLLRALADPPPEQLAPLEVQALYDALGIGPDDENRAAADRIVLRSLRGLCNQPTEPTG